MSGWRWLLAAALLAGCSGAASGAGRCCPERAPPLEAGPPTIGPLGSLEKLRPEEAPPAGDRIEVVALRGECEAVQIGVGARSAVSVTPGLAGELPTGVEVRLYRVGLVELLRPSGPEGRAGRWPDPLIPAVDAYVGEVRDAFPLGVPAGESRAIWVEICVAVGAPPGRHEAAIELNVEGAGLAERRRIPLALEIERAAIPATASLPTSFGFSARRAALGHFGAADDPERLRRLDRLYRTALLRHRISAHGGTMEPPPFRRTPKGLVIDFRGYDEEVGPFLSGEALPSGARATTVELRTHPALRSDEERIAYWRAIAAHHRRRGWKAILFDYPVDEPDREDLPPIRERARLVKRADPSIRFLLTASLVPELVGPVDLWTPNLNCLFVKERPDEFCPWRADKEAYRRAVRSGALLWWYQSCSSHGCGEEGERSDYFRGWPSYVVDASGTRARVMGWLAFAEGIGGELYYDTVYAYAPGWEPGDPWRPGGLWAFGGNGDGTLFYPGTPERIGGTRHVPIESIRLQQIRDGLEDYELLRLVASRPGGREVALREVRRIAPAPFRISDDPRALEQSRLRLIRFLRE